MMASKKDYLKYCRAADIPVTRTERRILNEQTNPAGLFSVEGYIAMCENEKVFLTKNQRKILKYLPTTDDSTWTVMGKQSALKLLTYEIYHKAKYGA